MLFNYVEGREGYSKFMSHKPKLWTKDFIILSSTNFFIFLTFYLLMVTLTAYTIDQFHTSPSQAGLASSIFVLGAVLVRPIAGKTINHIGQKKMLIVSLALFMIACMLYFFTNSLTFLFLNRIIHGMAFGIATTATATIAAGIIPAERRGEGTGYFSMSMNIAMAIGPFIGLMITQYLSYTFVFVATIIFSIAGLLATVFIRIPSMEFTEETTKKGMKWSDFFEKSAVPISILVALIGFIYSSVLSFLTSYAQEIHLVSAASFFFVMFAIFLLVSRPFTGQWFDKYGENRIIYPSILLFAIGLLILSQAHIGAMLLIAGAIIGVGYGTYQSSTQAIVVKEAPSHRIGLATSTYFLFTDLGIGVGPFLLGFVIPYIGFRGLYVTMSIAAFACIIVYYLVHGKKASNRTGKPFHAENF
ncbi:MFS transporter [Peribacillus asahii]|uniref:MFS transporter n=1 Tax=Peribacillus asahii TaxID=228899 RepID=UPI0038263FA7